MELTRRKLITIFGFAIGAAASYGMFCRIAGAYKEKRDYYKTYRIFNEEGVINAYNSKGEIDFSGIDAAKVINESLSNLKEYKIWKETVEIKGDFTLDSVINIPSYVTLEINGILRSGNTGKNTNIDLINIENQSNIDIIGGELIGKGPKDDTTGWGIRTLGKDLQNNNIVISGLYAHDFRQSGIAINKSEYGCIVNSCKCENNGLNGIGFGDAHDFIARNNSCRGNLDTGLNVEDGWDFELIDNTCTQNIRHNLQLEHGVRGKIIGGRYSGSHELYGISIRNRALKGRETEKSQDIDITDVFVDSNALSGLMIQSSERINVIRGTFKNNGQKESGDGITITDDHDNLSKNNSIEHTICYDDQINKTQNYGIQEISGDNNTIIDNDVRNNIMKKIKIVGPNTIEKNNIY